MINWFDMPAEGLSNGGLFEVKELEVTENGTYEEKGEMYNKVVVNVEGGGGSWQTVFEGSVTTVEEADNVSGDIRGLSSLSGDSIKATFNGTKYDLPSTQYGYGAIGEEGPDFSEYPLFIFTGSDPCMLYTETAGTYTLKIEESQSGGSSDFSTAILTVTNSGETMSVVALNGVFLKETPNRLGNYIDTVGNWVEGGNTATETMLLYNGEVYIYIDAEEITSFSGDLVDMGDRKFKVTGDCSITAKGLGEA